MTDGTLYRGAVMHRRLGAIRHRFRYRVFSVLVDLDRLPALGERLRLFSYNRANVLSFHDRDHGPRDGTPLRPWVEGHLAAAGLGRVVGGRIRLLCFPRLWGYVFNPLSVYFCDDPDGRLAAIVYEVANTFGGRHAYVEPVVGTPTPGAIVEQTARKGFYVSPFIADEGRYRFRVLPPADRMLVAILQEAPDGQSLHAVLSGRAAPMDDAGLLRAVATHPLMTLKVIAAIYWQAVRLRLKGARFRPPPKAAAPGPDRA